MRYLISALCLFILIAPVFAGADPRLAGILGPQVSPGGVTFRCYIPGAHTVRIAGDWSGWKASISLIPGNREGYFEVTIPLFEKKKYRYRLIVDGIWQRDYANPNREMNVHGDEISWFEIRQTTPQYGDNPQKIAPQRWRFYYKDPLAEHISLVGSFNNYNPFEAVMLRDSSGVWVVEVQVLPGEHFYCFVVDGSWLIDPTESRRGINRFGQHFNRFMAD
jgi:1,4-alpha-glucan branching enzyme